MHTRLKYSENGLIVGMEYKRWVSQSLFPFQLPFDMQGIYWLYSFNLALYCAARRMWKDKVKQVIKMYFNI